ncbi:MAG TPA: PH domain-containing protein [Longimicrobiales bacterium]
MNTVTASHHGTAPSAAVVAVGVPGLEGGRGTLRPHRALLAYYALTALACGPAFLVLLLPRYFRYHTLRYEFDDEGVTMRWGVLFRREVSLTYSRIQDIHLTSNVLERWLGLAKIEVQTASASAKAEMTIEGLREFEAIRDLLYSRMRGASERHARAGAAAHGAAPAGPPALPGQQMTALPAASGETELAEALHAAAAELRALREELARRVTSGGGDV